MIAQSNKDYYNILLEACKEAFEVLEQKDFLYTNEAMIENDEISFSSESIEHFGTEKSNEMIVQYRLKEAMIYNFLTYLERQYLLLKRDMLFERKDFYKKCLTALNIEFTKFLKEGGRVPIGYNFVKNPDVLLFLESMKFYLKGRAEVPDKISQIIECEPDTKNESQQAEAVIPDNGKNSHPKHDPNLWNDDCFELFKYLYDCYYKKTKRQITNIWFYLKENGSTKYILKATKEQYEVFILDAYHIKITNFDKAPTKWEDKERNTIDEHRINFEDSLK
jgi:hypothetical protein